MLALGIYGLLSAPSVMAIAKSVSGFRMHHFGTALIVAGMYGVLHARWSIIAKMILFLPMWLTFGPVALVINTCLLDITDKGLNRCNMDSLWTTFISTARLTILNDMWA